MLRGFLRQGLATVSSGGGIGLGDFSARVRVTDPPRPGTRLTVPVFGDNPGLPGDGPSPGFNLREVEVICFPGSRGLLLYRVESGDTLTGIVRKLRDTTPVTSTRSSPPMRGSRTRRRRPRPRISIRGLRPPTPRSGRRQLTTARLTLRDQRTSVQSDWVAVPNAS